MRAFPLRRRRSRGVAFVVVIWVMVLLAVLLSGFVVVARTEALQARFLFDSAQARYAAIAERAASLRRRDLQRRPQ